MKSPLVELTEAILHQLPPSSRFGEEDAALVLCHQPILLALEDDLVQGFYDTVYAHAPLRAIMAEDDRSAREATLRQWWQRTVAGPFDERYWTWQVLVGLVHKPDDDGHVGVLAHLVTRAASGIGGGKRSHAGYGKL